MLILSRRLGESIVIGENISVTILGIAGNQIRIGIDAPKDIAVHREEIHQRINNKGAQNRSKHSNKKSTHHHSLSDTHHQPRVVNR